MQQQTQTKVYGILRAVLELPPEVDVVSASSGTTASWDSLAHAVLIGAIESELGIQVDAGDSLDLTSCQAIVQYLEDRGL